MQTAEEVWRMEFPFPVSWLGQHVLEPWWIRRMRHARVVAISPSTAAALRRYGVDTETVIPPGCEPPQVTRKLVAPSAAPRLIWIGRLVRTKLPEDAIAAFKRVREVMPGATLDLVGGGYLEADIQGQHHPGVTVHGFVDETVKASLLSEADLFLLPGTREGWGIVAMEAASYGVPVVAYDIPGLRDVVLGGVTGVLVPAGEEALGSAAASLLLDPDRWMQISEAARKRAKEFTWDRSARELLTSMRLPVGPFAGLLSPGCTPSPLRRVSTRQPRAAPFKSKRQARGDH
jgi:glycosyltransferase involved in cell wall biosynthesis